MSYLLAVLHAQRIRSQEILVAALAGESVTIFRAVQTREFAHRRRAALWRKLLLLERNIAGGEVADRRTAGRGSRHRLQGTDAGNCGLTDGFHTLDGGPGDRRHAEHEVADHRLIGNGR